MKKLLSALLGIFGLLFAVPGWALPTGYTELQYIESTGTQWIDTGYKFTTNNHKYIVKFSNVSAGASATAPYWLWGSNNGTESRSGAMVLQTGGKLGFGVGNITAGSSSYTINNPTSPITLTVETKDNKTFSISGGSTDYTNVSFAGTTITNLNEALFGSIGVSSTIGYTSSYKLYNAKIYENNTLVRDFVPAKNSSGVVGMYDTVSNRFYTNAGTGEFIAGDPVTDNPCRNLFNKDAGYINAYINANSGVLTSGDSQYSFVIPVQPNTKYTLSGMSSGSTWGSFTDNTIGTTATSKLAGNGTITTGANDRYLIGLAYATGTQYDYRQTLQIEEGDTATAYTPYNPSCGCNGELVTYTSATGTVVQDGTPTLDNPIDPVFYTQGDMVLRKVGDYADSYDATTGKITRRVGVKVLDGTERWTYNEAYSRFVTSLSDLLDANARTLPFVCTHCQATRASETNPGYIYNATGQRIMITDSHPTVEGWEQWLAQQYAAGTPVTVWYPLETETTEDWPASQCTTDPIKIATTKYNESAFGPLNTALANAISVVDTVVSNTITQAASIATLQAQKQTRPNDIADDNEKCPAGKKCLLVEDASGVPHWYEIVENAWDLPVGYTQLQYIESTGTQYISTGITASATDYKVETKFAKVASSASILGNQSGDVLLYVSTSNLFIYSENAKKLDLTLTDTDPHTIVVEYDGTDVTISGDYSGTFATTWNPTKTIDLFANNYKGNHQEIGSVKIYSAKFWNNGVLVRDFVPAKNSSGVIGMYDLANGVFYENAGTGEFIAGDPVSE